MNSLLPLLLFSSLIINCYSAVFLERQRVIPGHKDLCYDKEDNIFYKRDEEMKWKLKVCGQKICKGPDGRGFVYAEIQTCGKINPPENCRVEAQSHLPYPDCCERILCPDSPAMDANLT